MSESTITDQPTHPDQPPHADPLPRARSRGFEKSPLLAAFLSFFPGIGSIYNGLYLRGVTFFATFLALIWIADNGGEIVIPAVFFTWLFNVVDAYRQAQLINHGHATDLGILAELPTRAATLDGKLAAGLALLGLGLVTTLDVVLGFDMSWIARAWPIALVIAGGLMIRSYRIELLRRSEGHGNPFATESQV